jgi:putative MATE family efflux protein
MKRNNQSELLSASVEWTLIRLSIPTTWGLACVALVSAVDAGFIAQLGTDALATTGIAVPLVHLMSSMGFGLSVGANILLSEAIGSGDARSIKEVVVASFQVLIGVNLLLALIMWLFAGSLLELMGGGDSLKLLASQYVQVSGLGFPILGALFFTNNIMRAHGDTFVPGITLTIAALCNGIADYLLVFGNAGFPEMGVVGAACASNVGWFIAVVFSSGVIVARYRRVNWFAIKLPRNAAVKRWKALLGFGATAALTQVLLPLSSVVVAGLLASYGNAPVAAYTLAGRIEALAIMPALGIGNVLRIFIPFNAGAGKTTRIRSAIRFGFLSCLVWAMACWLLFLFSGRFVVGLFTSEATVAQLASITLLLLPLGMSGRLMVTIANSSVTSLRQPQFGTVLALAHAFAITLPMAFVGGWIGLELFSNAYVGFLGGLTVAGVLGIPLALCVTSRVLRQSLPVN